MTGSYVFVGHDVIESFVDRRLRAMGWNRVERVADADVALTYCVSSSLLEDVYFDGEGLVKNASQGTVLVDLSPSTPSFAREISAVATVNDLIFIEAPLVARDPLSSLDFICYAASEDPSEVERMLELLEALAASVVIKDAVGAAQLAKASETVKMAARVVGAIEADALVRSLREVTQSSDSDAEESFMGGFPVELFLADIVAAMATADDVDLILPQLEAAMHLLELMVVIGGSDMSPRALSLLYREESASAAHGLDWTRAENLYAEHDHGHDHEDGFDDYGFEDDFGFAGGFGGYSAN